jgi:hypothetical protein
VRVNIEDDLWTSGRLLKLARVMKWEEAKALGHLVLVYRATQKAGIISETQARVLTVCVLHFESDEETDRFLTAMVSSQLAAVLENGDLHIRGNERHVERLDRLLSNSGKGGKASAVTRQKKINDSQTESQASAKLQGTTTQAVGNAPYSLLPSPSSKEVNTKILDLAVTPAKAKRRTSPGASQPGVTIPVRDAWVAAYEKRYPGQRAVWGAKEGGQAANLLKSFSADELGELVRHFFAWKRPEVIRSGHSFGTGSNSFLLKIHELRADMAAPQRRAEAAKLQEREKISDTAAADADQVTRIVEGEVVDAYATRSSNQPSLGETTWAPTKSLGGTAQVASRPVPWKDFGPPPDVPCETPVTVRDDQGTLRSTVKTGRGGSLPFAETNPRGDARTSRAGAIPGAATDDGGGTSQVKQGCDPVDALAALREGVAT